MRFCIKTLVDVTQTNARKGQDPIEFSQQANFNTMYNTIGLRSNPTEFDISVEKVDLKDLGFGSNYKGKHNVWTVEFRVEADESTNVDFMNVDFDLIPVITGLTETVDLDKGLFITLSNHGRTNVLFERIDK
jgi:hypothetical protein